MKTTGRWISIGMGLAWAAFATGACGGNSNGPKDAGVDSPSYVTVTDAGSGTSSASSSYTVPMNPLPGPVTVIQPDGSAGTSSSTASSGSSSGSSSHDAGASDAANAADASAD